MLISRCCYGLVEIAVDNVAQNLPQSGRAGDTELFFERRLGSDP